MKTILRGYVIIWALAVVFSILLPNRNGYSFFVNTGGYLLVISFFYFIFGGGIKAWLDRLLTILLLLGICTIFSIFLAGLALPDETQEKMTVVNLFISWAVSAAFFITRKIRSETVNQLPTEQAKENGMGKRFNIPLWLKGAGIYIFVFFLMMFVLEYAGIPYHTYSPYQTIGAFFPAWFFYQWKKEKK